MGLIFNRFTYTALFTSLFFQVFFCSSPEYAGGVETTNGITIAFTQNRMQGTAPVGSRIVLCDSSYAAYKTFVPLTPLFIVTTFADDAGNFRFDSLPDGFYNLTARNVNADSGTLITDISINRLNSKEIRKSSDYTALGSIAGQVYIDSQSVSFAVISVMGTELNDTTDGQGMYTIENVPQGVYKITGSVIIITKLDSMEYYLSNIDNIVVPENGNTTGVNLNLEKIN